MGRLRILVVAYLLCALCAHAHDPSLSTVDLHLEKKEMSAQFIFVAGELRAAIPRPDWKQVATEAFNVQFDGKPSTAQSINVEMTDEGEAHLRMIYPRTGDGRLVIRSLLIAKLGKDHHQFVVLVDETGKVLAKQLLSASDNELEVMLPSANTTTPAPAPFSRPLPATAPLAVTPSATVAPAQPSSPSAGAPPPVPTRAPHPSNSFVSFLKLGIEHILTGYDHLLFLLGLLIVGVRFWSAARIITSFTVAHSISLALATFHIVSLPSRVVEPLIAASIVYVGLENIFRRDLKYRWLLTFVFGLVHGLGFATVLRQLGVGATAGGVLVPLVSFNLGVELGQIGIAAVVVPLIWQLGRRPDYAKHFVPVCSLMITALGAYWLLQRTLLH